MNGAGESDFCAHHVFIDGRVQGVGFRWHTRAEARALGLGGWVRNLDDGRVEAHVQGPQGKVSELLEWMATGPSGAVVDSLEAVEATPTGSIAFEIR